LRSIEELAEDVLKGDKRSIARLITMVENSPREAQRAISMLYPHTGRAWIVGITGPPGVGKSILIEKLVKELRRRGETVGVVAVDPTSPFSGGAFLGDRVRMQNLSTDEGVFIRSMATRGGLGGVARATKDAVKILDAASMGFIIVETVGAGQSEVEIMKIAETVVVVLSPGAGDDIQALKAGMMEISDIFVVNKSDLKNADDVVLSIRNMLMMQPSETGWRPPIIKTVALTGLGVDELLEKIIQHREYIRSSCHKDRRRRRIENEIISVIKEKAAEYILSSLKRTGEFDEIIKRVLNLETDPYSAVDALLTRMMRRKYLTPLKKGDR
jgi:LAO/AO transport system kinase